jgi:hypothetical protein
MDEFCDESTEMFNQLEHLGREYSESKAKVAIAIAWIANCGRSPEGMEKVWQISDGKTTDSAMAWTLDSTSTPPTLTGEISDTATSLSTASWLEQLPEKADIDTYFANLENHLERKSELEKQWLALQRKMNDLDERQNLFLKQECNAALEHSSTDGSASDGKIILDSVPQSDGFGALPLSHSCCCLLML